MNHDENNGVIEGEQVSLVRRTKAGENRRRLDEILERRLMRSYTEDYYDGSGDFSAMRDESPNHDIFE